MGSAPPGFSATTASRPGPHSSRLPRGPRRKRQPLLQPASEAQRSCSAAMRSTHRSKTLLLVVLVLAVLLVVALVNFLAFYTLAFNRDRLRCLFETLFFTGVSGGFDTVVLAGLTRIGISLVGTTVEEPSEAKLNRRPASTTLSTIPSHQSPSKSI